MEKTLCYCKKGEWCEYCDPMGDFMWEQPKKEIAQLEKEWAEKLEKLEKENQLLRSTLQHISKRQCVRQVKYDWRAETCLECVDKNICVVCMAKETLEKIS